MIARRRREPFPGRYEPSQLPVLREALAAGGVAARDARAASAPRRVDLRPSATAGVAASTLGVNTPRRELGGGRDVSRA